MIVVHYYRCSTDKQDTSIATQREQLTADDVKKGDSCVKTFADEGKSGSVDQHMRKAFWEMLKYVQEHPEIDAVKVLDTSRWGRLDNIEGAEPKARLRKAGCLLACLMDGTYDFNNSQDRMISGIKDEMNNDFSVKLGGKSLDGKIRGIKAGNPCAAGGPPAYGYHKLVTDPDGIQRIVKRHEKFECPRSWPNPTFIPGDEIEVETVRLLWENWLKSDVSYTQLARELTESGCPAPTGGPWRMVTVRAMLANPAYCGAAYIGKNARGKFARVSNGEGATVQYGARCKYWQPLSELAIVWDAFDGIISKKDWIKGYEKCGRRAKLHEKPKASGREYALKGILRCGACGRAMQGWKQRNTVTYRCGNRPAPFPECNASIRELDALEVIFSVAYESLSDLQNLWATGPKRPKKDNQKAIRGLLRQIEQIKRRMTLTSSDETFIMLDEQLAELRTQHQALERQDESEIPTGAEAHWEWLQQARERLLWLQSPTPVNVGEFSYQPIVRIEPAELRARLQEIGVTVKCFFTDTGKRRGRWKAEKGRMKIELLGSEHSVQTP